MPPPSCRCASASRRGSGCLAAALAGAVWWAASSPCLSFRAGLKGSYFALITLAFAEVLRIVANSIGITGGGLGMLIPMKAGLANFQFAERIGFYFLILALAAASIALAEWLRRSRFGAQLAAIRENEDAGQGAGHRCVRREGQGDADLGRDRRRGGMLLRAVFPVHRSD